MKKLTSLPSTMSYPPLSVASRKHNVLVIGGNINAQIGKNVNHKFSLHNSSNRNGQHLTVFTLKNRLTCFNINFQKRKGKLWTNIYANNTKALIDYFFINKKWSNSALTCGTYSSFEGVSSDHRIVTAKIRMSLRRNATQTNTLYTMTCPYLITGTLEINMR